MLQAGRAALVVNTRSRKGAALYAHARKALATMGYVVEGHAVAEPGRIAGIVAAAVAKRPHVLVLGGGDGTISGVVDELVGRNVPLALLPFGTANSFARSLGLPLDLDGALNILGAGHRRWVDLGRIDGDYFANVAALGMAPLIGATIPDWLKKGGGRLGYVVWAVGQFARFRPFRVRIDDRCLWALEVRIANGSFQGGAEVVENASVDSGAILVQVITGRNRWRLLADWAARLLGLPHAPPVEIRGRSIRIAAEPPQPISIDGEVLAHTPVVASVLPRAIEVFAPPPGLSPAG